MQRIFIRFLLPIIIIMMGMPFTMYSQQDYSWGQVMHGGGWLVGIDVHPSGSPIFTRGDTSDGYKWNETEQKWENVVNTKTLSPDDYTPYNLPGVSSIVSAPSDANRAYMAWDGKLFYSTDQAESWTRATDHGVENLHMEPNARDGRLWGERLAVDPKNADVVYFGSNRDGLLRTVDGGVTWSVISEVPIGVQVNNRSYPGLLVAVDGSSELVNGMSSKIIALVVKDGVYESNDGGQSWTMTLPGTFDDISIGSDGTAYIVSTDMGGHENDHKVFRSVDGAEWVDITPPVNQRYRNIEVNGDDVWLSAAGGINYYYSPDKGENWNKIDFTAIAQDVPWLQKEKGDAYRSGGMSFNSATNSLWISVGDAVYEAVDPYTIEQNWYSRTLGIGMLVVFDMVVAGNGDIVAVAADKGLVGGGLNSPPTEKFPDYFIAGWDLGQSDNNPEFIVVNINQQPWNPQGTPFNGWSNDNAKTFTSFATIPPDDDGHAHLEVASTDIDNIIWVPNDNKGEIYYTTNRGDTWEKANYTGGEINRSTGDGRIFFTERYIRSCPVEDNTFYIVNRGTDIYKSIDSGANWTKQNSTSLPYGNHSEFKTFQGKEGHLLYTSGEPAPNGTLHHSTDGGVTWETIADFTEVAQIATGKEAPGTDYPTVFVQGKLHGEIGLYRSIDSLQTWVKINDYPMGIFERIRVMEADRNIFGNIYAGFFGRGVVAGQFTGSISLDTHSLTVNSGSGDGDYLNGTIVNIKADTAGLGEKFAGWTGDVAHVADVNSMSTLLTMPAENITVTASYVEAPISTLTIINGEGSGDYTEDDVVDITADAAPEGQRFAQWTGDVANVADIYSSSTTITISAVDATVTATYEDIPEAPGIKIISSTAAGQQDHNPKEHAYDNDESTRWASNLANVWIEFQLDGVYELDSVEILFFNGESRTYPIDIELNGNSIWSGNTSTSPGYWTQSLSGTGNALRLTMTGPNSDGSAWFSIWEVRIYGIPSDVELYSLNVNNGSGSGDYLEGTEVNITADAAPQGQRFAQWTGDVVNVADVESSSTTITMPAGDATVTATYEDSQAQFVFLKETFGETGFYDGASKDYDGFTSDLIFSTDTFRLQHWNASTGYTEASGGLHVVLSEVNGFMRDTLTFKYDLSTTGYWNIRFGAGIFDYANAASRVTVEFSTDSLSWTEFDNTNLHSGEFGPNGVWGFVVFNEILPNTGMIYIRLITRSSQTHFDDFILMGYLINTDATLSDLTLSEGTLDPVFDAATYDYTAELPSGTTATPTVNATPTDANAIVDITDAADVTSGDETDRTTTVIVTAEDGTTQLTYSIVFNVAPHTDATLSDLTLSEGTLVPVFDAATYAYTAELPSGTTATPTVTATPTDANATVDVTDAVDVTSEVEADRTTTIVVTAEDGATQLTYSVVFDVLTNVYDLYLDNVNIFPNPFSDELKVENISTFTRIELTNLAGQHVRIMETHDAERITLNISNLKNGVYLLNFYIKDARVGTRQVIKQ